MYMYMYISMEGRKEGGREREGVKEGGREREGGKEGGREEGREGGREREGERCERSEKRRGIIKTL